MKILHLLKTGDFSGAEKVAIKIIAEMKRIYGIDSVYVSPSGQIDEILAKKNIEHAVVATASTKEFRRVIKEHNPDVIHAHDFSNSLKAACIKTNVPIISHLHNNPPWIKSFNLKSFSYFVASRKFRKILLVSKSVEDEYYFSYKIRDKYRVIGNPIEIKEIVENEQKETDVASDVLFVGRLAPQKNPLYFVYLIAKLKEKGMNISVAMLGDGELRGDVEREIIKYDLGDTINLLGFQDNVYSYMQKSKVLCLPSLWEGFGLVAVEAMALGKPVVAAPVGGLVSIVDSSCGKLCKTEEEYLEEMNRLLLDSDYYYSKSNAAKKRADSFDNVSIYMEKVLKEYREVLL